MTSCISPCDTSSENEVTTYIPPGSPTFFEIKFSGDISSYDLSNMSFSLSSKGEKKEQLGEFINLEKVEKVDSTSIKVRYNGGSQSKYKLIASLNDTESTSSFSLINNIIYVESVEPSSGSINGGTLITITGINFLSDISNDDQVIFIGENKVTDIVSATSTEIKCYTPEPSPDSVGSPKGILIVQNKQYMSQYTTQQEVSFSYDNRKTPEMQNMICEKISDDICTIYPSTTIPDPSNTITIQGKLVLGIEDLSELTNDIKNSYPTVYDFGKIEINWNSITDINSISFRVIEVYNNNYSLVPFTLRTVDGISTKNSSKNFYLKIKQDDENFSCTAFTPKKFSNYGGVITIYCIPYDLIDKGSKITIADSINSYDCFLTSKSILISDISHTNIDPNEYQNGVQCILIGNYIELTNFEIFIDYIPSNYNENLTIVVNSTQDTTVTYSNLNITTNKFLVNNVNLSTNSKIVYLNNSRELTFEIHLNSDNLNLSLRMLLNWTTIKQFDSVTKVNNLAVYKFVLTSGLPSGEITIALHADNIGFLLLLNNSSTMKITIPLFYTYPSSINQILSSYYGGVEYHINGSNFNNIITAVNEEDEGSLVQQVYVCGIEASSVTATSTIITFTTPKLLSWQLFKDSDEIENVEELTSSFYENIINYYTINQTNSSTLLALRETDNPFNNNFHLESDSYIGIRITQSNIDKGFKIYCTSIGVFASTLSKPYDFNDGVIEGSQDGINWTTLNELPKVYPLSWSQIPIDYSGFSENTKKIFNYIRIKLVRESYISGIKFYGKLVIDNNSESSTDISCAVQVKDTGGLYNITNLRVLYQNTKTLFITSASPSPAVSDTNGLSDSNISLSINNINDDFSLENITSSLITIKVYGTQVATEDITIPSTKTIQFKIPQLNDDVYDIKNPLYINILDYGQIPTNKDFINYNDKWDNVNTWGGDYIPGDGANVTIKHKTVILNISNITVNTIFIKEGGVLVIEDERDYTITLNNIIITDGGELIIGSEETPFTHKIVFYFTSLPTYGSFSYINKVFTNNMIASYNGKINIFGSQRNYQYTTLFSNSTSTVSTKYLKVKGLVDWVVGDEIGFSSSTDALVILSISKVSATNSDGSDGSYSTIEVNDTVQTSYTRDSMYVVLLTRNIVITTVDDNKGYYYGPSIVSTGDNFVDRTYDSEIQIQNVYFKYAGQGSYIGKFPISLERLGRSTDSFIKYCSFGFSVSQQYII